MKKFQETYNNMTKNIFDKKYPITKIHGTGNDFVVYVDLNEQTTPEDVKKICHFHTGVGADGVITISKSRIPQAQYRMKYFNADGSLGEMCGNGIRCFAKYLLDNKLIAKKSEIPVDTDAGIIITYILKNSEKEALIRVDMGRPVLENPDQVAKRADMDGLVRFNFSLKNQRGQEQKVDGVYVGMGNPHAVFFVEKGNAERFAKEFGPQIEIQTKIFPQKTNVEFVEVNNRKDLTMYVWERGVGLTLACGTGACATLVAGILQEYSERDATIHLPGGVLKISWDGDDSHVFMTGSAMNVFVISNLVIENNKKNFS
jgi:diaminopimelate epimerase